MSETLTPRTGDLLLYRYTGRGLMLSHPDSWLIQKGTHSPYSHMVIVLDEEWAAQSNPGSVGSDPCSEDRLVFTDATADVQRFEIRGLLQRFTAPLFIDLFRPGRPEDAAQAGPLDAYVHDRVEQSKKHVPGKTEPGQVVFSTAHPIAIGLLHWVQNSHVVPEKRRIQDALVWAMGDHERWLFCSEFVHRALEAGGADFRLRPRPMVDLSDYAPDRQLIEVTPLEWLRSVFNATVRWLRCHMQWDVDDDVATIELWNRIRTGFEEERRPEHTDTADFVVPADLACSPSFRRIGSAKPGDKAFTTYPRYRCS